MKKSRKATALAVVLVVATATPVLSNPFGGPYDEDGNYAADNGTLLVYLTITLDDEMEDATEWALDNQYDPLSTIIIAMVTSISGSEVRVYQANYGNSGWVAAAPCVAPKNTGGSGDGEWCEPRNVRFNRGYYPDYYDTRLERRFLACHELGHTLGLHHLSSDCMAVPADGPKSFLGSHNVTHINDHY